MKRPDPSEKPYLSWCLVVRNSATKEMRGEHTFERTLQMLRERTPRAEIVVVDTCSRDHTPEIAEKYADVFEVYRGPNGDWDEDLYVVPDMAAARERAIDLASGAWIGWVDDDDALPDADERDRLLAANNRLDRHDGVGESAGDPEETVDLEDVLRFFDEERADIDWIWCPYLYQRDEHDHAIVLQDRERFFRKRDRHKFAWVEKAHEHMVAAKPGELLKRFDLHHLLFVHEKSFSEKDLEYSMRRHWDVLLEEEPTTRRCLYLAAYAPKIDPPREEEFIQRARKLAVSAIDRYRSLVALGNFHRKRGFYFDAAECYGAAINLIPTLPDAWFRGADLAIDRKDPATAVHWIQTGAACAQGQTGSEISPWMQEIRYPSILALELEKLADAKMNWGDHEGAETALNKAKLVAERVYNSPAVVGDEREAWQRFTRLQNRYEGHQRMREIHRVWDYLRRNDEPQKATELVRAIPHTCEDHPLAVEIEIWAREVETHRDDPGAYERFYNTDAFGQVPTTDEFYAEPDPTTAARINEVAQWILAHAEPVTILDYGSFDGIMGVPLFEACGEKIARYVAVELNDEARGRFRGQAKRRGFSDRLELVASIEDVHGDFDLALACEVIEHVPDPWEMLLDLRSLAVRTLFVSTPWGAFDSGRPPPDTKCGERSGLGHLRAHLPRDIVRDLRRASWKPIDLRRVTVRGMHVWATRDYGRPAAGSRNYNTAPVAFAVRGALWDWNGRTVHAEGMGFSESAIVFLAERLAADGTQVDVFGPVPGETVHAAVPYWRREKLRHLRDADPETKIVVSRSPAYAREIDAKIAPAELAKILWLQDTHYPELSSDPDLVGAFESIVVVSEWHRGCIEKHHGIEAERMTVIPNWIPPGIYDRDPADWPERDPHYFVYASSPDRGLVRLLRLWPQIRALLPDARLDVFYGWKGVIALGAGRNDAWLHRFEGHRRAYEELRFQEGIRERGMRPQREVAEALFHSGAWIYPTDFAETFGAIAAQARAAGAPPVCTALAGLNESAACPQATLVDPHADDWEERFLDGIERAVRMSKEERVEMHREALAQYGMDAVMPLWREVLSK